jgi:hypothetical protein
MVFEQMKKEKTKKIISIFILIATFLVSYLNYPKQTSAQGIFGSIEGLVPAISQLPLCKGKMTSGVANLFGGGEALGSATEKIPTAEIPSLSGKSTDASAAATSVPTYDASANTKLDEQRDKLAKIEKSTKSIDQNDSCLKSIGRLIIKQLLQKFTLSTVEWINGGLDSEGPKFVQNPGAFFEDIAKNEILQFGMEINNPQLFPFGRAFMENQAIAFQTKFAQNAQYSLNEMIQSTTPEFNAATFQADFSQGGWDAWTYMTQVPANNPLGFNLMASNELQKRLEGTNQSDAQNVRDALQQAGGFLGDYRCADPEGVTKEEHEKALAERSASAMGPYQYDVCKRWEYVTPGGMVADAATKLVNYPDNNLLKAEDLNDAIAAILDALLNSFTSNLMSKGFAEFSNDGSDGSFYQADGSYLDYTSVTENDYPSFLISASTFLQNNPYFDIRKDLTQALIDEQRIFMEKLIEQNKELESTIDGKEYSIDSTTGKSNAYGLIPAIDQLDYCIPGPHPGWEQEARENLDKKIEEKIPDISGMNFLQIKSALNPNFGTTIMNWLISLGVTTAEELDMKPLSFGTGQPCNQGGNAASSITVTTCANRIVFQPIVNEMTGLGVNIDGDYALPKAIESYDRTTNLIYTLFSRYVRAAHNIYIPEIMPLVTKEAEKKFNKLAGYRKLVEDNKERIVTMQGIIAKLTGIKEVVDNLNCELDPESTCTEHITKDVYENELGAWRLSFGRISSEMVSGDDIATVDNVLKQIRDEKDYVINNLLKGPQGCENDQGALPDQIKKLKRPAYPFPILYTYPTDWYPDSSGFLFFTAFSKLIFDDSERSGEPLWGPNTNPPSTYYDGPYAESVKFCKFYEQYGKSTSAGCESKSNPVGPTYIYVTDLIEWQGAPQSPILGGRFETTLGIY